MSATTEEFGESAEPTEVRILTDDEIDRLNDARAILKRVRDNTGYTRSAGVMYARLDVAQNAVFEALSSVHVYGDQFMTDDQLHGSRAGDDPDPAVA